MNITTPRNLSLINATLVCLTYSVLAIVWSLSSNLPVDKLQLMLFNLILFVITYLVFRFTVEKFVYNKIKVIYKTIHRLKLPEKEKKNMLGLNGDVLERVNQDMISWGKQHLDEIESLKKLEGYRREFIGNVSHELKTPIFNIQGYVLTLLDGGLEDPSINRNFLLRTEKSINRMVAIVEDLEEISMLESGEIQIQPERFDILELTRDVMEFLEMKARKRRVKLHFNHHYERPLYVKADSKRIRQVLINLVDNGIKYSKESNGRVKISFYDMDENILIELADNGIGIAEENLPRLFERFYRTDKARSREMGGTGLGLAIVKHILESHNQTINVRSTYGIGTTFGFTLKKG